MTSNQEPVPIYQRILVTQGKTTRKATQPKGQPNTKRPTSENLPYHRPHSNQPACSFHFTAGSAHNRPRWNEIFPSPETTREHPSRSDPTRTSDSSSSPPSPPPPSPPQPQGARRFRCGPGAWRGPSGPTTTTRATRRSCRRTLRPSRRP